MKKLAIALGVAILLVLTLRGAVEILRVINQRRADACWVGVLGADLNEILASYPSRAANAAAVDAERAAEDFGYNLTPRSGTSRSIEISPANARLEELKEVIKNWEADLVGTPAGEWPPIPGEILEVLHDRRRELDVLISALRRGAKPMWESDLAGGSGIMPNLLAQLRLNGWLVADAARQLEMGDSRAAQEALDAAWRLHEDNHVRHELISRLIGSFAIKSQMTVLRRVPDPWPLWSERLQKVNPARDFPTCMYLDTVSAHNLVASGEVLGRPRGIRQKVFFGVLIPAYRFSLTSSSRAICEGVSHLPFAGFADFDAGRFDEAIVNSIPEWNSPARIALPNFGDAWLRVLRVSLGVDLTRDVVRVRSLSHDEAEQLLESLPKTLASRLDGATWKWTRNRNEIRIELRGDVPEPDLPEGQAKIRLSYDIRLGPS